MLKSIPLVFLDDEQKAIVAKVDGEVRQFNSRSLEMIKVTPEVIVQALLDMPNIERDIQRQARAISDTIDGHQMRVSTANLFRGTLGYEYRTREAAVQQTELADAAHKYRYDARAAWYDGRVADSISGWLAAMTEWDKLFQTKGFEYVESDGEFIRDLFDIVERFVIILDGDNKVFTDVVDDKVPMEGMIRAKLYQESNPEPYKRAMDFAKKYFSDITASDNASKTEKITKRIFRNGLSENAEERQKQIREKEESVYLQIALSFESINDGNEFMQLAPLSDIRDQMLEANALYILALEKQNKPLPEPLPLRSFVELMMQHDPAINAATSEAQTGLSLSQNNKPLEALTALEKAIDMWKPILAKYPLIRHDPTLQAHDDLTVLATLYSELLRTQKKELPEVFPFKDFITP